MTYTQVINRIANHFRLSWEDIVEADRQADKVKARHIAMFFCYRLRPDISDIANHFRRDRKTVHHAIKGVKSRIETDKKYATLVAYISLTIGIKLETDKE
jgi:chromosomal replication initiation ATPase DnaA